MLMTEETVWTHVVLADGQGPPPAPDRARQTIQRTLAGSMGALLVLVVAGYLLGARIAESQALTEARNLTEIVGATVVGPHLTSQVLAGQPTAVRRLDRVVDDQLVRRTLIRRVKIWSADGVVLYSNDPAEVGRSFRLDDAEARVLSTGRSVASVSDLSRAENVADRALGSRMVEVYTDLRGADGRPVLFEAYLDYDQVEARRTSVFKMLSTLVVSLLGVFMVFQVWFSAVNLRWLRRRQAELRLVTDEVSARERRSLARDLHDGVVQELVGTAYLVDGARASMGAGELARADMLLSRTAEGVRASIQALRSTLIVVYPPTLRPDGLGQALDDLAQPLRTRGVEVTVEDRIGRDLPGTVLEATYRVAQEAVRNIGRHARATKVTIRMHVDRERLCLVVSDDGIGLGAGLSEDLSTHPGHLGLRSLADAALEAHAYLELSTAPDRGTEMTWEIPL